MTVTQTQAWVESLGGPLIVVPVSALAHWKGSIEGGEDDYDRACAVNALAAAIPIGEAQGLVLGDEPATTCYLPEHRAFLRWLAADSEAELVSEGERLLADPATPWEDCGHWEADGPAVLIDSVTAGAELGVEFPAGGTPAEARVDIPKGRFKVRAIHTDGEAAWAGLVQLIAEDHRPPPGPGAASARPEGRAPAR
ncbi:Imm21 family immunity protein [Amycolatopsis alba]|uniref:Imm21 family immunity protein n=1 Tax=Amycolatopsis alba TaxID=76020 RepID=UPI000382DB4B|nr:Imm21 family immunity protein [Amycolatopsis alba]